MRLWEGYETCTALHVLGYHDAFRRVAFIFYCSTNDLASKIPTQSYSRSIIMARLFSISKHLGHCE